MLVMKFSLTFCYKGLANFNPTKSCAANKIQCENSYGNKICVNEKVKKVACAKYLQRTCDDDSLFLQIIDVENSRTFVSLCFNVFNFV